MSRLALALAIAAAIAGCGRDESTGAAGEPSPEAVASLARCLREGGWVVYSASTCAACRAQRKAFGAAFAHIDEVECNPHAPGAQTERCLERGIRVTPTWVRERDGEGIDRLEAFQPLEALAAASGCPL